MPSWLIGVAPASVVVEAVVEGEVLVVSVVVEVAPVVPVALGDVAVEAPAPVAGLAVELVSVAAPEDVPAALDCSGVLPAPAPDSPLASGTARRSAQYKDDTCHLHRQ